MAERKLCDIIDDILDSYNVEEGINHIEGRNLPSREAVEELLIDLLNVVFPGYYEKQELRAGDVRIYIWEKIAAVYHSLSAEIVKSLPGDDDDARTFAAVDITAQFLNRLPALRDMLKKDVHAAYEGDPAAGSYDDIILSYPGLFAVTVYRLAHELYQLQVPLIPRIMTEYAHGRTGIDIHPGAQIGERFFIDHGTGVVIGETTEIGRNVRIYQGVTLGALSLRKGAGGRIEPAGKRHPTIGDNVVIYAGATILGGQTTVGSNCVIGGNVWLLDSVPPNTTLTHQPPAFTSKNHTAP